MATGGIIPPQGRPPTAPGVGSNARRHDLEQPKTPGLAGSSLQYGDVQKLEGGQRVAPPLKQANPVGQKPQSSGPPAPTRAGPGMSAPDPIEFAKRRLGGTLGREPAELVNNDMGPWLGLFRQLANSPGSSGLLRNVLTAQLGRRINSPTYPQANLIDWDRMDEDLEVLSNGL